MEIQRTIWPIGQGAFYTESFIDSDKYFNIIYDCGSYGKKRQVSCPSILEQSIHHYLMNIKATSSKIDYLFISHFHTDHINGIKYLLDECRKKSIIPPTIVMPLMDDDTKLLYFIRYYFEFLNLDEQERSNESVDENLSFIRRLFFGESDYRKLEVSDSEPNEDQIRSGDNINVSINGDWLLIPVLYIDPTLSSFAKQCREAIDNIAANIIGKIKNNPKDISTDVWSKIKGAISEVRKSFKNSKLNNMALMLYSGKNGKARVETFGDLFHCYYWYDRRYFRYRDFAHTGLYNPGVLYTGDMEMNKAWDEINDKLFNHYSFTRSLRLYQISHHGDENDFNKDMSNYLSPKFAFCCYGTENTYHHPEYRLLRSYYEDDIRLSTLSEEDRGFCQRIEL